MANSLNITASNFGLDSGKRFIGDVSVSIRLIGDTGTTFYPIGYTEIEKSFESKRSYADFTSGIPEVIVAKDVVKIENTFSCKLRQFQAEVFALVCGAEYVTTGGGLGSGPRVIFGSDLPTPLECSLILSGETKDGDTLELYIRKCQITPETVKLALGSKEHASIDFSATVISDEHPHETNWDWPVIGEVESSDCDMTSTETELTVANSSLVEIGMYAYSEGEGFIGIVTDVSTTGSDAVTIDRVAGHTTTGIVMKFIDPDDIARDNIAFFAFSS